MIMETNTKASTATKTSGPIVRTTIEGTTMTIETLGQDTIVVHAEELAQDIQQYAMMHGLKQKIVDAAAIARNTETGRSASVEDKHAAMMAVVHQLTAGDWNRRATGERVTKAGVLFEALCALAPTKPREEIRTWLAALPKKAQAELRKNPTVAAKIVELMPKPEAGVGDELLAKLGIGDGDGEE